MSVRRMLPFILINVLVSAGVVLAILYWWDARNPEPQASSLPAVPATPIASAATVVATIQSTVTPDAEEGPLTHVVKAGDTLGSLSQFYDVTLEDLMEANGLSNPDLISLGQELVIPVGGVATATPAVDTEPETTVPALPTPIATEGPSLEGEVVVEITAVTGVADLEEEAVQISNLGGRQIALLDWTLADENGHQYTFGQVTLFGDGAAIQVHTASGPNGPADLHWGLESSIWESGERVTLFDPEGGIAATFDIP